MESALQKGKATPVVKEIEAMDDNAQKREDGTEFSLVHAGGILPEKIASLLYNHYLPTKGL